MIQNNGIIEYHLLPHEKLKINKVNIIHSLDFLNEFNISKVYNWIIFSNNEDIKICISTSGIIEISIDINLSKIEESIQLLDKLAKKIVSMLNLKEKFLIDLYIAGLEKIGIESLIKQKIEYNELDFDFKSEIKVRIIKNAANRIILIKGADNVEKITQIYSTLTSTKISNSDFQIKEINLIQSKTLTKEILLNN
jgi:hypothetical protein